MANDIRLTGNCYVADWGSDSNDGLTKETPKRTVQAGLTLLYSIGSGSSTTLIIVEGVYEESILQGGISRTIIADGKVILKATGDNTFRITSGVQTFIGDFEFRDYVGGFGNANRGDQNKIIIDAGFAKNCQMKGVGLSLINGATAVDCYSGTSWYSGSTQIVLNSAKLINSFVAPNNAQYLQITNSDLDEDSLAYVRESFGASAYQNSNIKGKIKFYNSATVDISYNTLAEFKAAQPTFFANSFSQDTQYNCKELGDYTVKQTSPNIKTGINGVNIGSVVIASSWYVDNTINLKDWLDGAILFNVQIIGNAISLIEPNAEGWIELDWKQILNGKKARLIKPRPVLDILAFNSTYAAPHINNMNVLDSNNGVAGMPSRRPNRLTYQMMWSNMVAKPQGLDDADNSGYLQAGVFGTFPWFKEARIDSNGVCNGEDNYNYANPGTIRTPSGRWVKQKIWFRNDRAVG